MTAEWARAIPTPSTEGFWCPRCQEYRVQLGFELCPSCADDDKRSAQEKKAP